jgi:hypothetical protein
MTRVVHKVPRPVGQHSQGALIALWNLAPGGFDRWNYHRQSRHQRATLVYRRRPDGIMDLLDNAARLVYVASSLLSLDSLL